ncbi:MAG TPA: hypothetical protein VEB21_18840, partial [Terriglobales bacterium]|nr:hypothetical protein [Terriglobales bacterium]
YTERCIVIGYGVACLGSVERYLGLLAAVSERWDDAARHLATALQINGRLNARPLLARTELSIAELRLRRRDASESDRRDAAQQVARVTAIAEELGMAALSPRIAAVAQRHGIVLPAPARATAVDGGATVTGRFRRDGEHWEIAFAGRPPFRLKDLRGLAYLAYLLQHPQRQQHATQLVALFEMTDSNAATVEPQRQRLVMLQEELAAAQTMHDLGRVAVLEAELDSVLSQLIARASAGDKAAERARVSVTKRISIAMQRIARHDRELARYLDDHIKTGSYCCYSPDPAAPVQWQL